MSKTLYVFTDGGAKGNPGPAAAAFVVKDNQGKILAQSAKLIGRTTNNVAEYSAVIEALNWIKKKKSGSTNIEKVEFFLDSKLVVCQLNGIFKIKNRKLRELMIEVRKLEQEIGGNVSYCFVPREKNRLADFLVQNLLTRISP